MDTTVNFTPSVVVSSSALPTGAATETTAAAILAKQPAAPALETGHLATIDTSTSTASGTLTSILAKIIAAPATAALQSTIDASINAVKALLPASLVVGRLDVNLGASGITLPISGSVTTSGTSTVSGTVTANIGTAGSLALDATLTGGTTKAINRSGAKGTSVAADVTSTAIDLNHQALDVILNGTTNVVVTSAPTTAVTIASLPALTAGAAVIGHVIADSGSTTAVTSLPALPAGANAIGSVIVTSAPTTAVTIASLPALTTGAATIGKVDQGAGGASAWKVDGSAVTQPVSLASTTANIGTTNGLALDATLTVGTLKAIARGGAKGTTTAADVTSTAIDLNRQALDVILNGTTSVVVTSAPTTAVTIAALPALTAGSAVIGHVIADTGSTTAVTSLPSIPAGANAIGSVIVTSAPTTAVTVAALPLPSGAATSALQGGGLPAALALGGGLKIDGSGTALPVSGTVAISGSVATTGTVTANIGTSGALALDATITGGTAKAIVRGAAKGTTVAADATTTVIDLNHQALDVSINGTPAVTISSGSVVVTSAPTTAVTIATLPALTAGAATIGKADQGAGGVSAWKVDGSAVTQPVSGTVALSGTSPVSGTVTANIGTSGSLALDATLTGGTAKSIARSGAKGTSAAADVTSTVIDLNHQALDVVLNGTTSVVVTSAPTTAVTAAALPLPAGASTAALQGAGLPAALGAGGGVKIDGSGTALPTSVASLPLPSGASTSALQGAGLPAALVTGRLDVNIGASAATVPTSSALGSTAANQVTSQTSFTSLVAATLIGQQVIASSRSVVNALLPATPSTSIPTAGQSIKSGATAVGYTVQFINNTGGSIIAMVFDAATTRANGAVPLWVGSTVGTGLPSTLSLGHTVNGLSATTNGIWLQFSSTQTTLTTIASTAITATAITN